MVVRVKTKTRNFVMIDKGLLEDSRLSWKAKGVLAYLLSKPDNWTIKVQDIEKRSIDGEKSVRSGLKELIEAGYAEIANAKDSQGRFLGKQYIVYEIPNANDHFRHTEFSPYTENGNMGSEKESEMTISQYANDHSRHTVERNLPKTDFAKTGTYTNNNSTKNKTTKNKCVSGENLETHTQEFFEEGETPLNEGITEFLEQSKNSIGFKQSTKQKEKVAVHLSLSSRAKTVFPFTQEEFKRILIDWQGKQSTEIQLDIRSYFTKIKSYSDSSDFEKTRTAWKSYVKMWLDTDKQNNNLMIRRRGKNKSKEEIREGLEFRVVHWLKTMESRLKQDVNEFDKEKWLGEARDIWRIANNSLENQELTLKVENIAGRLNA